MVPEGAEILRGDAEEEEASRETARHRSLWERTLRLSAVASVLLLLAALACRSSPQSLAIGPDVVELPAVRALDGIGTLVNHETGLCLDWGNIIVDVLKCYPHRKQQLFEYDPFGQRLVTHGKSRCLDSGGKYIHVWECDPASQKQQWYFDGEIISQGHGPEAKCLAGAQKALWLQPCGNGGSSQRWRLQRPSATGDEPLQEALPTLRLTTTTLRTTTTSTRRTTTTIASTTSTASMMEVVNVMHFPNVCLAVSDDGSLHVDKCGEGSRWEHDLARGTLRGRNGHCLDAGKEGLLAACDGKRATQAWGVRRHSGQILTEDGLCLDASLPQRNHSKVRLHPCQDDHMGQKWFLQRV